MANQRTDKDNSPRSARVAIGVVSAFLFFATGLAFLTGFSRLFPAPFWEPMWNLNPHARSAFEAAGRGAGALLWVLAALTCAAGVGLMRRRKWAWAVAVALFSINGAGDAVTLVWTRDLLRGGSGLVVAGIFLVLLLRPSVRRGFNS